MKPDNADFNKAINDIINSAIGRNIIADIEEGKISNLPNNFEIVDDFQCEVYEINGSISTL
jgi:hypothetical protein